MASSRRSPQQSTQTDTHPSIWTPNYHWATSSNLAVLTLPGGEQHLVVKRVKRRSDGAKRAGLYLVQTDVKGDPVERLARYGSLMAAQSMAEERFESGEFKTGLGQFPTERWRNGNRYPAKLIMKMRHFYVEHQPGMTVGEATDLVVIMQIDELMRRYFAMGRAS
jgi:hypothetical protein